MMLAVQIATGCAGEEEALETETIESEITMCGTQAPLSCPSGTKPCETHPEPVCFPISGCPVTFPYRETNYAGTEVDVCKAKPNSACLPPYHAPPSNSPCRRANRCPAEMFPWLQWNGEDVCEGPNHTEGVTGTCPANYHWNGALKKCVFDTGCCGNYTCDAGENTTNCPSDCGGTCCYSNACATQFGITTYCGDGICGRSDVLQYQLDGTPSCLSDCPGAANGSYTCSGGGTGCYGC